MIAQRTEGIVLQVTPFQDYHQIAALFTPEHGVLKLVGSHARSKKSALFGCFAPLQHIEVIYMPTQRELAKAESGTLINAHLRLREDLDRLNAACEMANTLLRSQMPNKAAPLLYGLIKSYLHHLPETSDPAVVSSSFMLKVLRHEGLISLSESCTACGQTMKASHFSEGQFYCPDHKPVSSTFFSEEELQLLLVLGLASSMQWLKPLKMPSELTLSIRELFHERISH